MEVLIDRGGNGFVIKSVWVGVMIHADADEAVPGVSIPEASKAGKRVVIVRFDQRTDIETIEPESIER